METFTLTNGDRVLRFTGERLAHATSREGASRDQLRWTEVDIYRTKGGSYVMHRVGKSRVYHDAVRPGNVTNGKRMSQKSVMRLDDAVYDDLAPDPVTKPDPDPENLVNGIILEQDRALAFVAESASGLVEASYTVDRDQVRYLAHVNERALRTASEIDERIAEAFLTEHVA